MRANDLLASTTMTTIIDRSPRLLLSPRDAAAAMGISEKNLWNLKKSGAIKCVRLGRNTLCRYVYSRHVRPEDM